jgi:isochorismate synthase
MRHILEQGPMLDSSAVASCDDLEAPRAIERMIERAIAGRRASSAMLSMSLVAPLACAERLLLLRGFRTGLLWSTSADDEYSGVGAARTLCGSGESRFEAIRAHADRLFRDLEVIALDGAPAPAPRLVGGFAFNAVRPRDTIWQGFGAALFVLPRIAYTRRADRAWLTLTASVTACASATRRRRLALDARRALEVLSAGGATATLEPESTSHERGSERIEESAEDWSALVAGICAEIAAGRLEKAVAARRVAVRVARRPHAALVLERLRKEAPACTRFALRVGARTFLGASPENLVQRSGLRVMTEAVAGSVPRRAPEARKALLHSDKDRAEHAIVVREIRAALAPLCAGLSSDTTAPLRLRHLLHLRTRIVGTLIETRHVIDLVAALHPTPAVGGTPRRAALAWLDAHERADRGYYGGPFGAFDSAGDGHFVVAIRSGLLDADAAHLFAGAGIVAGSKCQAEWTETRWKLCSMMAAVGVR